MSRNQKKSPSKYRSQKPRSKEKPSPNESELELYDNSKDEQWNKPVINRARDLFVKDYPYERIFLLTGLPPHVWYKKEKPWKRLKEKLQLRQMKQLQKKSISRQAEDLIRMGSEFGARYLRNLLSDPKYHHMEPKDFRAVMQVILDMHKIKQLEEGAPTDIKGVYDHMNLSEMRSYLVSLNEGMQAEYGDVVDYIDMDVIPVEQELREIEYVKNGQGPAKSDSSSD